jgi:hypothetical protein
MRRPNRIEHSVALVETMVEHIFSDYKSIHLYGVKRRQASYDVWVEYEGKMITVQSLTRDIIVHCTDPDADTARTF